MQYLDILSGSKKITLDQVVNDTTGQVKEMMETTMTLIDKYAISENKDIKEIKRELGLIQEKIKAIEPVS
jgi:acetolactate synthase small subunit